MTINRNKAAEQFLANMPVPVEEEDYGFCYIPAEDKVYLPYPQEFEENTSDMTEYYYLNAFTAGAYSQIHRLGRENKNPDINHFHCRLFAYRLNYEFGITHTKYGMTNVAEQIYDRLHRKQHKQP